VDIKDFLRAVAETVAQRVQSAPPRSHDVWRAAEGGSRRQEQVTLTQIMAEVADHSKELTKIATINAQGLAKIIKQNELIIENLDELTDALKENSRLARKALKSGSTEDS
jgi:SPX domain protein involved in polyphosphate accumulation